MSFDNMCIYVSGNNNEVYLGGRTNNKDVFVWMDKPWRPIKYFNWATDEPGSGDQCVVMIATGEWIGRPWNTKLPFVCEYTI